MIDDDTSYVDMTGAVGETTYSRSAIEVLQETVDRLERRVTELENVLERFQSEMMERVKPRKESYWR